MNKLLLLLLLALVPVAAATPTLPADSVLRLGEAYTDQDGKDFALASRRGEDIGAPDVLERYQSWRRFDSTTLALGMDWINALFSNDNPALRTVRDLGLGLVNTIAPLRRSFMRQAAGLSGQTAKLLTGKAL